MQDLSLAPSDDGAAAPLADAQPVRASSAGVANECLADDNVDGAASPALPAASGEEDFGAFDGSCEHTPVVSEQDDAPQNVLSPAAPMSLFSPTADATSVVSPSAAASYAEAAEALGQDSSMASVLASPIAPLASGGGVHQGDGHAVDRQQVQQDTSMSGESGGSER